MLLLLRVKHLALIDELTWEPSPGFNLITGETGAGKSILIDGFNLLLGERADKTLIRSGEESCTVEGEIELKSTSLRREVSAVLEAAGAEPCEDNRLLLKRLFSTAGTNRQFINGSAVTLQVLKQLGDLLVDLHGPHDHQSLLVPERQLEILDAYLKLGELRVEVGERVRAVEEIAARRAALDVSERERAQRTETLTRQVEEIQGARLKPGDDETVERDYRVAANARQLLELAGQITGIISESDGPVLAQLAQVEKALHAWEKIDPTLAESAVLNRSAIANLQELLEAVQVAAERIDLDAGWMRELEDRLGLIQSLKRKYGRSLEAVIARGEAAAAELSALSGRDEELARLAEAESKAVAVRDKAAEKLSAARAKVAGPLGKQIQQELRVLGFAKGLFRIDLAPAPLSRTGTDRVDFIFAPNAGEEPRPLRLIASSGEMARVMLAIKTTLAEVDAVPILVFDEVDANVGGETALQVGKKLRSLGETHQVFCITHLPQVAAQGGFHFSIEKAEKNGRTVTKLSLLEGKARVKEIARMLGGHNNAAAALAEQMLREGAL